MITLQKIGDAIKFTFSGNTHYLQDGTVEVPVNSLSLTIDDSGMATFRKSASNDIFISANYGELGMTKDELVAWYKENMVDGGGSDITSGDVQSMIDESISGKADSSAVTEEISAAVSGKQDTLIAGENITISGNVISAEGGNNAIELTQAEYDALVSGGTVDPSAFYIITDAVAFDPSTKVDTSAFTAYSAATNATLSGKQDTLSAGTGIEISGNVISATGGGSSTFDENYPVLEKENFNRGVQWESLTSFTENSIYVKPNEGDECAITIGVDDIGDGYVNLYLTGSTVYSLYGGESAVLDYVNIQRENGYIKITQIDFSKNVILGYVSNSVFYFAPYIIESGSTEGAIKQAAQKTLDESIGYSNNFVKEIDSFQLDNEALRLYYSKGNGIQYSMNVDNFLTKDGEIYNNNGLKVKPVVNSGVTTWSTIMEVPNGKDFSSQYNFGSYIDGTYKKFRVYYNSGVTFDDGEEMHISYNYSQGINSVSFAYDESQDAWVTQSQDFTCTKQNYYLEFEYIGSDASFRWEGVNFYNRSFNSDNLERIDVYGKQLLNLQEAYELASSGVVETSAITTSITSSSTDAQVPSAKCVYDQLGGLKLVKLTQAQYDALATKDNSTLYVIVN